MRHYLEAVKEYGKRWDLDEQWQPEFLLFCFGILLVKSAC